MIVVCTVLLGAGCTKDDVPTPGASPPSEAGASVSGDPLADDLDAAIEDLKVIDQ